IRKHPVAGAEIVGQIKALEAIVPLVLHHHERYDGTGYPAGLAGETIPLGARIIALADAYDAMTSSRPYRPAKTRPEALQEVRLGAGRQFDPWLAKLFLRVCHAQGDAACRPQTEVPDATLATTAPGEGVPAGSRRPAMQEPST
ncbi:MAG: Diguanylate cyclase and metal dependent phosphohydrolase, partial [Clostridia bacterium 62_21]